MPLDTYENLQTAVLNWIARPDDPLVSPSVPDMITLFEREADRRLRTRWSESSATLTPESGDDFVSLPSDFGALRSIRLSSNSPILNLRYVTREQLTQAAGEYFTIEGLTLRLADAAGDDTAISIGYIQGLTPLSDSVTSNWLLENHPDAYLFGTLAEAEAFIANDERVPGWIARREAVFKSIIDADRKARWGGGGMQIRPDITVLRGSLGSTGAGATGASGGGASTLFDVTLTPNATSTIVSNPAIFASSYIELSPMTENASQSLVLGIWIEPGSGSATINHVSYSAVDQTFRGLVRN